MKIDTDAKDLYKLLEPKIEQLYIKFCFIDFDEFKHITLSVIKRSIDFCKDKSDYEALLLERIESVMYKKTNALLRNKDNLVDILTSFIKSNFKEVTNYDSALYNLSILISLLTRSNFNVEFDHFAQLIKKNEILYKTLFEITEYNKVIIKKGNIDERFDAIFVSYIEIFCTMEGIEIYGDREIDDLVITDSDILGMYLKDIGKMPILTLEEERILLYKAQNGDKKAKNRLIECNLKLVVSIAKKYQNMGVDLLDLIQEGNMILSKVIDDFDLTTKYKFSTYATWWIRQRITRGIKNMSRNIRIPVHKQEKYAKFQKCYETLKKELGYDPDIKDIAGYLGISLEKANELSCMFLNTISINAPINKDSNDPKQTDFEHFLSDKGKSVEENVESIILQDEIIKLLERCHLKTRELEVLTYRFGLNGGVPMTLEAVGEIYGLTRERIRQIEKTALKKIRDHKQLLEPFKIYVDGSDELQEKKEEPIKYSNEKFLSAEPEPYIPEIIEVDEVESDKHFENPIIDLLTSGCFGNNYTYEDIESFLTNTENVINVSDEADEENSCLLMIDFIKDSISFYELTNYFTEIDSMIISLKLGYIGEVKSNLEIAEFLGVDSQTIAQVIKKVFLFYKQRVNDLFNQTEEIIISKKKIKEVI